MQVFRVVLQVVVNTVETVSETEIKEELNQILEEKYTSEITCVQIVDVEEYN